MTTIFFYFARWKPKLPRVKSKFTFLYWVTFQKKYNGKIKRDAVFSNWKSWFMSLKKVEKLRHNKTNCNCYIPSKRNATLLVVKFWPCRIKQILFLAFFQDEKNGSSFSPSTFFTQPLIRRLKKGELLGEKIIFGWRWKNSPSPSPKKFTFLN